MKNISPRELSERLHDGDLNELLIDVRSPAEFRGAHVGGAKNIPLESVKEAVGRLKQVGTVYVMCASGGRSSQACEALEGEGVPVVNLQGGLSAWTREGFGVEGTGKGVIPVIRQVMIVAGTLILSGLALGAFVHPYWYGLSLFVGGGLLFSGISGFCTMSWILEKMPWNR